MQSTHITLKPGDELVVTFDSARSIGAIEVFHVAGTAPVYFTVGDDDCPTPEVAGDDTYVLTAGSAPYRVPWPANKAVVRLIANDELELAVLALFAIAPDAD